jgi:hypothetical protein
MSVSIVKYVNTVAEMAYENIDNFIGEIGIAC